MPAGSRCGPATSLSPLDHGTAFCSAADDVDRARSRSRDRAHPPCPRRPRRSAHAGLSGRARSHCRSAGRTGRRRRLVHERVSGSDSAARPGGAISHVIGARRGVASPCTSTRIPGRPRGCGAASIASISSTASPASTTSIGLPACRMGFEVYDRVGVHQSRPDGPVPGGRHRHRTAGGARRVSRSSIGWRRAAMTARPAAARWASIRRGRPRCTRRPIRRRRRCTWPAKRSSERSRRRVQRRRQAARPLARSRPALQRRHRLAAAASGTLEVPGRIRYLETPDASRATCRGRRHGDRPQLDRLRVSRARSAAGRVRCSGSRSRRRGSIREKVALLRSAAVVGRTASEVAAWPQREMVNPARLSDRAAASSPARCSIDPGHATQRAVALVDELVHHRVDTVAGTSGAGARGGGRSLMSAGRIDATVLIATFNRAALLDETLRSVRALARVAVRTLGRHQSSTTTRPTTPAPSSSGT